MKPILSSGVESGHAVLTGVVSQADGQLPADNIGEASDMTQVPGDNGSWSSAPPAQKLSYRPSEDSLEYHESFS